MEPRPSGASSCRSVVRFVLTPHPIEGSQTAVNLAQGIEGLRATAGDALQQVRHWVEEGARADVVVVDPPRAGVREGALEIVRLARGHVVMCSCNPSTLARDLAVFQSAGLDVEQVTAFDMFPHTSHVEVAVWLGRR